MVQIITNALYNLHLYIEKNEILHVVAYDWKYMNIVNSSVFCLSELEDMKSWKISRRNRRRCDEIVIVLASFVRTAASRNWVDRESLEKTFFDESLQSVSNAHPAYSWVAYL